jgi:hypothetical protein
VPKYLQSKQKWKIVRCSKKVHYGNNNKNERWAPAFEAIVLQPQDKGWFCCFGSAIFSVFAISCNSKKWDSKPWCIKKKKQKW